MTASPNRQFDLFDRCVESTRIDDVVCGQECRSVASCERVREMGNRCWVAISIINIINRNELYCILFHVNSQGRFSWERRSAIARAPILCHFIKILFISPNISFVFSFVRQLIRSSLFVFRHVELPML